jgi:pyruvate formate lyase activating enzyme
MILGGLQKTTLIDYPGKIACTVFTVGCNFRCGFCHNRDLVILKDFRNKGPKEYREKEIFDFLKKRVGILDGVCITGGEPVLQKDLEGFIKKVKKLGFLVKLDTNGSRPEVLKKLINKKLIDFVAMDVKTTFGDYAKVVGIKNYELRIKNSIRIILKSGVDYELRTTVVPGIHDEVTLIQMARELKGLADGKKVNWIWQNFRAKNCLDHEFLKVKPYSKAKLQKFLGKARKILPGIKLRTYE